MSRAFRLIVVFLLVLAACGGGDEVGGDTSAAPGGDAGSTAAPTTQGTAAPVITVGDDFCDFLIEYADNAAISPIGLSPDQIESAFKANLDAIRQAAAIAPGEIAGDVDQFAVAYGGFIDFFGEYDYNFLGIPEEALDDPRLLALEDPELNAAGDRIEEYCGIDNFIATAPGGGGGGSGAGGGGGVPGASLPAEFPTELVPPGSELLGSVSAAGGLSVNFTVGASIDEVVAYYTGIIGSPAIDTASPRNVIWSGEYGGNVVGIVIAEISPGEYSVNVSLI